MKFVSYSLIGTSYRLIVTLLVGGIRHHAAQSYLQERKPFQQEIPWSAEGK
jgi:hypothetical protein